MNYVGYVLILTMPYLAACASTNLGETGVTSNITQCEEPRPEACTMDYRPVCANLRDGGTKTYSNGCSACSDTDVVSWAENACAE